MMRLVHRAPRSHVWLSCVCCTFVSSDLSSLFNQVLSLDLLDLVLGFCFLQYYLCEILL